MAQLIETVRRLEAKGVGFRSLTQGIDTTIPGGTLVFHLFGAPARFERDLIRERTRAGLEVAARLKVGKTALYQALRGSVRKAVG